MVRPTVSVADQTDRLPPRLGALHAATDGVADTAAAAPGPTPPLPTTRTSKAWAVPLVSPEIKTVD